MSFSFRDILLKVCSREDLTREESRAAFQAIMDGAASDAQIGGLLVGLVAKGMTVDEMVGAATVMREKAIPIGCDDASLILDTCGTGGDVKGTFNISTAAAIIIAASGVPVVKHGNRSASSKSGSADVLEKLGVRLDLPPTQLRACLDKAGICFAFARSHHPAMKHVASARTSLGIVTIFNILGPLTNPAGARFQLLGVFAPELTDKLAAVLQHLGSIRAWVVHAEDGLDELSTLGPTRVTELKDNQISTWRLDPRDLGIEYARLSDLQVKSVDESADALRAIIQGEKGPRRDITLLNAAAGLVIAGKQPDLQSALQAAAHAVDSGQAAKTLDLLIHCSQTG